MLTNMLCAVERSEGRRWRGVIEKDSALAQLGQNLVVEVEFVTAESSLTCKLSQDCQYAVK